MGIQELLIRSIEALAWPLASVFIIVFLRKEILDRLKALQKIKVGSLEAEFQAALDSSSILDKTENKVSDDKLDSIIPELLSIAMISPKATIPHAWSILEKEMINCLESHQGWKDDRMGFRIDKHIDVLMEEGLISLENREALHELRSLRNKVSHNYDETEIITFHTARKYAIKCAYFIEVMKKKHKKNKS